MDHVILAIQGADGEWQSLPALSENDPPGSFKSDGPGGRQVFVFGYMYGQPGVWQQVDGVGVESRELRAISGPLEQVSDLRHDYHGEVYRNGLRMALRVSLVRDAD